MRFLKPKIRFLSLFGTISFIKHFKRPESFPLGILAHIFPQILSILSILISNFVSKVQRILCLKVVANELCWGGVWGERGQASTFNVLFFPKFQSLQTDMGRKIIFDKNQIKFNKIKLQICSICLFKCLTAGLIPIVIIFNSLKDKLILVIIIH